MAEPLSYVLITPARNEESHIEKTILSVVSQTILPRAWIIVSDGSTDRTDDIAASHARRHRWIRLVRLPERRDRHFAAKVQAFNAGREQLGPIGYDIIGNLDADISFEKDYLAFLLGKFAEDPRLGVAGTPFVEDGFAGYDYQFTNVEHVSGACQLFRRECFAEIGGYTPLKWGGIDWLAVTTARMKGWRTRSFPEMSCRHHRTIGTAAGSVYTARFKNGLKDYRLGSHPLWHSFRCAYQMKNRPYIAGGLMLLLGYFWGMISRAERSVTPELVAFYRSEQMGRFRNVLKRIPRVPGAATPERRVKGGRKAC